MTSSKELTSGDLEIIGSHEGNLLSYKLVLRTYANSVTPKFTLNKINESLEEVQEVTSLEKFLKKKYKKKGNLFFEDIVYNNGKIAVFFSVRKSKTFVYCTTYDPESLAPLEVPEEPIFEDEGVGASWFAGRKRSGFLFSPDSSSFAFYRIPERRNDEPIKFHFAVFNKDFEKQFDLVVPIPNIGGSISFNNIFLSSSNEIYISTTEKIKKPQRIISTEKKEKDLRKSGFDYIKQKKVVLRR